MRYGLDFRCVGKLRPRAIQRTINRIHCLLEDDSHSKNVGTIKKKMKKKPGSAFKFKSCTV